MSVPITIFGGYLGAGKTTLINRVLSRADDLSGLAVLVNDFGDVNIDAQLIRASSPDGRIIGLSNGCVCCSIQDEFSQALEALRDFGLNHVLLEASGVAVPAKLRAQCRYPGYHPRACLVLIDAAQHQRRCADKYVGYLVEQQVAEADVLVVTRQHAAAEFSRTVQTTPVFDVDDPELLRLILGKDPLHACATEPVSANTTALTACTLTQATIVSQARLTGLLDALPAYVQRVKGFVHTDVGMLLVQKAGATHELRACDTGQAQALVFIATAGAGAQWTRALANDWIEWRVTSQQHEN